MIIPLTFVQELWTKDDQCYAWLADGNLDTVVVICYLLIAKTLDRISDKQRLQDLVWTHRAAIVGRKMSLCDNEPTCLDFTHGNLKLILTYQMTSRFLRWFTKSEVRKFTTFLSLKNFLLLSMSEFSSVVH